MFQNSVRVQVRPAKIAEHLAKSLLTHWYLSAFILGHFLLNGNKMLEGSLFLVSAAFPCIKGVKRSVERAVFLCGLCLDWLAPPPNPQHGRVTVSGWVEIKDADERGQITYSANPFRGSEAYTDSCRSAPKNPRLLTGAAANLTRSCPLVP